MRPFEFVEPTTLQDVVRTLQAGGAQTRLIAGGSDLLGELKDEVVAYERVVSLAALPALCTIHQDAAGFRLGALLTLTQLEYEARFQGPYRMLAEAARGVATPEIRQQGTLGGNLCQRPRCLYYRSALSPCLKKGGTDCPAVSGPYQEYLSVMGGQGCFCVHASDLAPPLLAMEAQVTLRGAAGERTMPLAQFFAGPERDVTRENVRQDDEVLTVVSLPTLPSTWRGTYLKARERTAGDFPLVSVAVGYQLDHGRMQHVRVVLGGVAPVPWRSPQAEAVLTGQAPSDTLAARAAAAALAVAQPLPHNAFKVEIGRALVERAVGLVATLAAHV